LAFVSVPCTAALSFVAVVAGVVVAAGVVAAGVVAAGVGGGQRLGRHVLCCSMTC
jgi:hypothetical protein